MKVRTRLSVAAASAVATLGLLGGCSGDDTRDTPAESKSPQQPVRLIAPTDLPTAPALKDAEGAARDIDMKTCSTRPGEVTVRGSVRNTANEIRDLVVTISWTSVTSDVRGRGIAVVKDLKPDEQKSWSIRATVAGGATRCVPNVRSGQL